MKLVKCTCGTLLPESRTCVACGKSDTLTWIELPAPDERAAEAYQKLESSVAAGNFHAAENAFYEVIEWMPDRGDVYWLGLLALEECRDVGELLCKGFNPGKGSAFLNALQYSEGEEHAAYVRVKELLQAEQKVLLAVLPRALHRMKVNTGLPELQKEMQAELARRKAELVRLWSELEENEYMAYCQHLTLQLAGAEEERVLEEAVGQVNSVCNKVNIMRGLELHELADYQAKLAGIEFLAAQAAEERTGETGSSHPWLRAERGRMKKAQQQAEAINQAIAGLKAYEAELEQGLKRYNEAVMLCTQAQIKAESFRMADAAGYAGLSAAEYRAVLRKAGISSAAADRATPTVFNA